MGGGIFEGKLKKNKKRLQWELVISLGHSQKKKSKKEAKGMNQ